MWFAAFEVGSAVTVSPHNSGSIGALGPRILVAESMNGEHAARLLSAFVGFPLYPYPYLFDGRVGRRARPAHYPQSADAKDQADQWRDEVLLPVCIIASGYDLPRKYFGLVPQ